MLDLDALEPAWNLVPWKEYSYRVKPGSTLAIVSSSRGCKQHCSFCSQRLFWKESWRAVSAERFVDQVQMLRDRYGVNVAMIADEIPRFVGSSPDYRQHLPGQRCHAQRVV
jgi:anaerobic magnesium-protoporphyrin IX monomethyl ester cyclase